MEITIEQIEMWKKEVAEKRKCLFPKKEKEVKNDIQQ